jgi:hypothetical protein
LRRDVLSASLAVMCARWFVPSAHATIPRSAAQLLDLVAFCIIKLWPLIENAHEWKRSVVEVR